MDDFIITDILGEGAQATVYKAFNKKLGIVALKVNSCSNKNKFLMNHEQEILKNLSHKSIIKCLDYSSTGKITDPNNKIIFKNVLYLVLPFYKFGDLTNYIFNNPLPHSICLFYIK